MSDYDEKYAKAVDLLEHKGISRSHSNPPLWSLYRKLGLQLRPAHFYGMGLNCILPMPLFALMLGWIYWMSTLSGSYAWMRAWGVTPYIVAGVFILVFTAFRLRAQTKAIDLPEWGNI